MSDPIPPPLFNGEAILEHEEQQGSSFLPPFANAENKQLDANVRDLEKSLAQAEAALEENSDRIKIMDEHLGNVQQELKYTQTRVESKTKEIETETHLKSLAEREMGRLKKDIDKLVAERAELADKAAGLQGSIYKGSEKMDQFKLLMNWNQEELEQWALAQRQKEEDNAALEKYKHKDDSKVKELMLVLEKTSKAVVNKRSDLDAEVLDTQAAQIQLDKAAEDFRRLHAERQDLIRQWDEAMDAMHQRDAAIQVASEQFAIRKQELRQRAADLDAQARFLENEGANNKEIDARIAFYEREVAKAREAYAREQARLEEYSNELELVKATLAKAANELSIRTNEAGGARTDLDSKRHKLDATRKRYAVLKRKLETEFGQLDSLDAKVSELESLRKAEEVRLKAVLKELEALKLEQFKRSQKLFELRTKERELISEISGGQGQNKNLAARISGLDEQVVRQQELLYNVEFQLQQMGRKVARAGGVRSEEEARALNARIAKLTTVLEGVNQEHSMLMEQVKHAEEDLLQARRAHNVFKGEKVKVDEAIGTLKLENDMVMRQVRGQGENKEKLLVEHDVMALEVKRLRDILSMHADEVFSLENRKFQLKMSMEERKGEIEVHRDGLRAELRLARDDVHRITLELRERGLRVEKLAAKYETISAKHRGAGDGEDGEVKSQAYYVIKAAQEREELQREGDALDAQIRKAEREVVALEATLSGLLGANTGFGSSFRKVDSAASVQERVALREKLDRVYDKLKAKRAEESALLEDIAQAGSSLPNLEAETRQLQASVDGLKRQKAELDRKAGEQSDGATRAKRHGDKLLAKLGLTGGPGEDDIRAAELRDTSRAMLAELRALASAHPGPVGSTIAEAAAAAGLKLPSGGTPLGSRGGAGSGSLGGGLNGSRPGSARSGSSSVRSSVAGGGGGGVGASGAFGSVPGSPVVSRPGSSARLSAGGRSVGGPGGVSTGGRVVQLGVGA